MHARTAIEPREATGIVPKNIFLTNRLRRTYGLVFTALPKPGSAKKLNFNFVSVYTTEILKQESSNGSFGFLIRRFQ